MVTMVKETLTGNEPAVECQHHWAIEEANGSTSKGVCKLCGAERVFYNSFPQFSYFKRESEESEIPDRQDIDREQEPVDSELADENAALAV